VVPCGTTQVGASDAPVFTSRPRPGVQPPAAAMLCHKTEAQCQQPLCATATVTSTLPDGLQSLVPDKMFEKDPVHGWTWGCHPDLTPTQSQALRDLVASHKSCFAYSMKDITGYTGKAGPFRITLTTDQPIFCKPRRYSLLEQQIADEKCTELLEAGIITPAPIDTQFAAAATMPAKKDVHGNYTDKRFCIDYRQLNKYTVPDHYGMRHPEDVFKSLGPATVFSKIDARSGFHNLPIAAEDQCKTTFWWGHKLFMYTRCAFGLRNCPAFFSRVMDLEIAAAGLTHCACSWIDDVLVFADSPEAHYRAVDQVLSMLSKVNLKCHPDKSIFGAAVVTYLGMNVSRYGLSPEQAKVDAIRNLRTPHNVSELRSVLGFMNYYRGFVPQYSSIAAPLNALLAKDVPWVWGPAQQAAYQQLKDSLCEEGRALKRYDPSRPLILYTDWSQKGIGAVLAQTDDAGQEYMVACVSRSLNKHERNLDATSGELLSVVWAVKTLRPYLHGAEFVVVTDHKPLVWLTTAPDLVGKHARWALSLSEYSFTIQHRPGKKHQNADALSRLPQPSTQDCTGARLDEEDPIDTVAPPAATSAEVPKAAALAALQVCLHQYLADNIRQTALGATIQSVPVSSFIDAFAPTMDQLLEGTADRLSRPVVATALDPPGNSEVHLELTSALHARATRWVKQALPHLPHLPVAVTQTANHTSTLLVGSAPVVKLDTRCVACDFWPAALAEGIVLLELCGGMCSGLDACLSLGIKIRQYYYCDIDTAARAVAQHRVNQLCAAYPTLLSLDTITSAFAIPQDMQLLDAEQLGQLMKSVPADAQWLVVCGFECQDLSPAGNCKGLDGHRAQTFYDTVRIISTLQAQLQSPPGFIIENAACQHNFNSERIKTEVYATICDIIGDPVCLDAAQFGSRAHRLRNWWVNLAEGNQLRYACSMAERPPNLLVDDILEPGRSAQQVARPDYPPHYCCNTPGQPMQALPTLVSYVGSRAFTGSMPGMIWDANIQQLTEPTVTEREQILGYPAECTAAPGVELLQRHVITGRAMDGNTLRSLLAVCAALHRMQPLQLACSVSSMALAEYRQRYSVGADIYLKQCNPHVLPDSALDQRSDLPSSTTGQSDKRGLGYSPGSRSRAVQPWQLAELCHQELPLLHPAACACQPKPLPAHGGVSGNVKLPAHGGNECLAAAPVASSGHATKAASTTMMSRQPPAATVTVAQHGVADPHCSMATEARASVGSALPVAPTAVVQPALAEEHQRLVLLHVAATHSEQALATPKQRADIWNDEVTLAYLRTARLPPDFTAMDRKRITRRAKLYCLIDSKLYRCMSDGSRREVPPPDSRLQIVKQLHASTGHFGVKRTRHLVMHSYWWPGIEHDVLTVVKHCEVCGRVNASFNVQQPELRPLPIQALFYRWGVDLCGPLPKSSKGNLYCMICIEYLSKHLVVVPLPAKTAAQHTAYAFLANVLGPFGACAEVVTDRGSEFQEDFQQLLETAFIDHRLTSANHPQADGLAERAVQTVKRALQKYCAEAADTSAWDDQVHWIALGYRCSRQAATGLAPYELYIVWLQPYHSSCNQAEDGSAAA